MTFEFNRLSPFSPVPALSGKGNFHGGHASADIIPLRWPRQACGRVLLSLAVLCGLFGCASEPVASSAATAAQPAAVPAAPPAVPEAAPAPPPPTQQELLADYINLVQRRIRANMVYKDKKQKGNPETLFQIVLLPDMTIYSVKIITSSGDRAFDRAAKRAIEKTRSYPPLPASFAFSMFQTHKIKYRLHDF